MRTQIYRCCAQLFFQRYSLNISLEIDENIFWVLPQKFHESWSGRRNHDDGYTKGNENNLLAGGNKLNKVN